MYIKQSQKDLAEKIRNFIKKEKPKNKPKVISLRQASKKLNLGRGEFLEILKSLAILDLENNPYKEFDNYFFRDNNKWKSLRVIESKFNELIEKYGSQIENIKSENERIRNIKTGCRNQTKKLIKNGKLKVSKKCEECGMKKSLEVHHWDYYNAKDVTVYCKKCHEEIHAAIYFDPETLRYETI